MSFDWEAFAQYLNQAGKSIGGYFKAKGEDEYQREQELKYGIKRAEIGEQYDIRKEQRAQQAQIEEEKRAEEQRKRLTEDAAKLQANLTSSDNSSEVLDLVTRGQAPTATQDDKLNLAAYLSARRKLSNVQPLTNEDWMALSRLHPQIQTRLMDNQAQVSQFAKTLESSNIYKNWAVTSGTGREARLTGQSEFEQYRSLMNDMDKLQEERHKIEADPRFALMAQKLPVDERGHPIPPKDPKLRGVFDSYMSSRKRILELNESISTKRKSLGNANNFGGTTNMTGAGSPEQPGLAPPAGQGAQPQPPPVDMQTKMMKAAQAAVAAGKFRTVEEAMADLENQPYRRLMEILNAVK